MRPAAWGTLLTVPALWIVYNAWLRNTLDMGDPDWISESAVESQVAAVSEALNGLGSPPEIYPLSSVLDAAVRLAGRRDKPRLIFNLAEGFKGNSAWEMNVAALFELLEIPYTGNSARTLAIAQDKAVTKRLLVSENIPTPAWRLYDGRRMPDLSGLEFPLIAKPSREDASLGIGPDGVFSSAENLPDALAGLHRKYRQPILIESFIDGREIGASILEEEGEARVLPLSEISFAGLSPDKPRITSYDAKWSPDSPEYRGTPTICPADLEPPLRERIEALALATFRLLGGKDYGRIDFRLDPSGKPYILEYNPNPDISPDGGFARSLAASGRSYRDFIRTLLANNIPSFEEALFL